MPSFPTCGEYSLGWRTTKKNNSEFKSCGVFLGTLWHTAHQFSVFRTSKSPLVLHKTSPLLYLWLVWQLVLKNELLNLHTSKTSGESSIYVYEFFKFRWHIFHFLFNIPYYLNMCTYLILTSSIRCVVYSISC